MILKSGDEQDANTTVTIAIGIHQDYDHCCGSSVV